MTPMFSMTSPMMRTMFTMQRQTVAMRPMQMQLVQTQSRDFSLKMRKVRAKQAKVKKYKLKTKKAFQKRFEVCGSLRNKMFKFHAQGYRHLNRNKTNQNLKRNRHRFL